MNQKDPIKPKKGLNKKPNFKKERLEADYFNQYTGEINLTQFRSPGVYTSLVDTTTGQIDLPYNPLLITEDIYLAQRGDTTTITLPQHENRRVFNINVGDINGIEAEEFVRRIRESMASPSPQSPDGELLSYDLVSSPALGSTHLVGGEAATSTIRLSPHTRPKKKKSWWAKILDIYYKITGNKNNEPN